MVPQDKIIEIFCSVDDFCNGFESELKKHQISDGNKKRNRAFTLSDSEVIAIAILFHLRGVREFKHFYIGYVCKQLQSDFPKTVFYNRFVELMSGALFPMILYLKMSRNARCNISLVNEGIALASAMIRHQNQEISHKKDPPYFRQLLLQYCPLKQLAGELWTCNGLKLISILVLINFRMRFLLKMLSIYQLILVRTRPENAEK